jgi:hypothetical protein
MRKLVLIAAMLLLPAVAFGTVICSTDFEDASYGLVDGQSIGGAMWWTPWWHGSNEASIIDDPTGAGEGKVLAYQTTMLNDTTGVVIDNPSAPIQYAEGYRVLEISYYVYGNGPNWTNTQAMEWGPGVNDYFMSPMGTIEAWTGGDQWDPWAANLTTQVVAPLPVNQWFDVKLVFDCISQTYDYYVNGSLAASGLPSNWMEDNYVQMKFYLLDKFQADGDPYVLLDHVNWRWSIPEPSLLALGGLGLLPLLRRKKK